MFVLLRFWWYYCLLVVAVVAAWVPSRIDAFASRSRATPIRQQQPNVVGGHNNNNNFDHHHHHQHQRLDYYPIEFLLRLSANNNHNSDNEGSGVEVLIEKDLQRPLVNLKKESILFSEDPSTMDKNDLLNVWVFCKQQFPYVLTGCQPHDTTANDNPLAGIYNMLLVRLPTILAAVVYAKNLAQGHPLIVDVGDGPFVVNPLVVGGALYAILR